MIIVQQVFVVLGLFLFVEALFRKWRVWTSIFRWRSRINSEILWKLTKFLECDFCRWFHLTWIITLICSFFWPFAWSILIVPVIASGFIHLITKQ